MNRFFIFFLINTSILLSQSNAQFRRTAVMDGNNIISVINNSGIIGQPFSIGPKLSWKGIDNVYAGDLSLLLGVELPIKDYTKDGIPDTIHSVIITPVDRPGGGESGDSIFWGFEPVDGFFNYQNSNPAEGVALSNKINSWPEFWPDHPEWGNNIWNGLFGPSTFVGSQEAYFQLDDSNDKEFYEKYGFLPDSSNTNKFGNGIKVSVRYIQRNDNNFNDILYKIYEITNESKHDYSKLIFGELVGTYIGGSDPEWNDDATLFFSKDNFVVTFDFDNYIDPNFNSDWKGKVGRFGQKIIESPLKNKITSFDYFVPAGDITLSNDEEMWDRLTPGFYNLPSSILFDSDLLPYAIRGEDGDYLFGTGYFSLESGETKRIVSVLGFGYNNDEVLQKLKFAEALFHSNFDTSSINKSISFIYPSSYHELSENEIVEWDAINNEGSVEIWFSPDAGKTWKVVNRNFQNSGSYEWNTELFNDCAFGLIRIFIKNNEGYIYDYNQSEYFKINNEGNGSPFIKILNDEFETEEIFTQNEYDFNLLIGDPENNQLELKILYGYGDFEDLHLLETITVNSDSIPQKIKINFKALPNSENLKLRFEVSNGSKFYYDETYSFNKQTQKQAISNNNFQVVSGFAQVPMQIRIADESQLKDHEYLITFEDTSSNSHKTISVYDATINEFKLKNVPIYPYSESAIFDGLTFYSEDYLTQIDTLKSHWNNFNINNLKYVFEKFTSSIIDGYPEPLDYIISFSDEYVDSSNRLTNLFGSSAPLAKTNINFRVYQLINDNILRIQFAFTESGSFRRDTLSSLDQITLSNEDGTKISWKIIFQGDGSSYIPKGGDTLYLYTKKGLSVYDTLRIFDVLSDIEVSKLEPNVYQLFQNYPNPFNPVTIIKFQTPDAGFVTLKIFDILGREVKTLLSEEKNRGVYEVNFNANLLASGVYFYNFHFSSKNRSINYSSTKKMLLLK